MSSIDIHDGDKDAEIQKLKEQVALLASRFTSLAERASIASDTIGYTLAASTADDLKPSIFNELNRLNRTIEWTSSDVRGVILGEADD